MAAEIGADQMAPSAKSPTYPPSPPRRHFSLAPVLACAVMIAATPLTDAQEWSDPTGDVTLPSSDAYCGAAMIDGGTVHLFVRFADVPLMGPNWRVDWIIDTDQDAATGRLVGLAPGADMVVALEQARESGAIQAMLLWSSSRYIDLDPLAHTNYDGTNRLLHVFFPLELLEDDGAFDYIFTSTFGGSFGANEWAPQPFGFTTPGRSFTSSFGEPIACVSEDIPPPPPLPGEEAIEAIIEEVERLRDEGVISGGHAVSLIAKLSAALDSLRTKEPISAARQLLDFINEVEALVRSGILPGSAGMLLIDSAEDAADMILASTTVTGCLRSASDPPPRASGVRLRGSRDRSPLRPRR